jgi:nitroreductase/FMN reductase [NAD(P)H]
MKQLAVPMTDTMKQLQRLLADRFGEELDIPAQKFEAKALAGMAGRASRRSFLPNEIDAALLRMLCAVALSSPTKSDLQQRDIVIVEDRAVRERLDAIVGEEWVRAAPALLVFCGNNRRQRQLHALRGHPFVNDHLDAFFNAAVDAAIALAAFVAAAEAIGLGCCPLSTLRNAVEETSELLALPEHVFPVAGLALGWPAQAPALRPRLSLSATVHRGRFDDTQWRQHVLEYDARRRRLAPYARQREPQRFGEHPEYSWSEDKARQYARPERADFGAFVRRKGFNLA